MSLTLDGTLGLNSINIGANIPGTGAFTTLSASSTVSGSGFSTYLASPPAIGGTTAAGGTFTNLTVNGNTILGNTSSNTVTLNAATVTLNNSTVISAASTRTLTLNGGAGSNGLVIDASNNVGIGFTPNSGWASSKALQIGSSIAPYMALAQMTVGTADGYMLWGAYLTGSRTFAYTTTGDTPAAYRQVSGTHAWFNATSGTAGNAITFNQAMTLDASGNLLVGDTATIDGSKVWFKQTANAPALEAGATNASFSSIISLVRATRNTTNGSFQALNYYNDGAVANRFYVIDSGAIYSTSTSITGISDVRHKENIRDLDTGLSAVLALKPRRFDWKEGKGIDRKDQPGFIAQEVEKVLPELVELWTESQEDKNEYKGIRLADMIPTLVKAIQELSAEIETLKQRIK